MPKNIVICIDGTGNEFGACNSNVVKLYQCLQINQRSQIAYYHPGLGTMGAPSAFTKIAKWATKVLGLAFGFGLSGILTDTYSYLMEKYEDGDRIYLFGFSRGAYSCRALAAMIHMFGLLHSGNQSLIPYVIRMFKTKKRDFEVAANFKATFSRPCTLHFVGLWDTVNSIGWLYDPLTLPYTFANPDISIGRHAISIDEKRAAFRQNLWSNKTIPNQSIEQLWFAGVHSDVGGGYAEPESGLAKISLEWMLREAQIAKLLLTDDMVEVALGQRNGEQAAPDPAAVMHKSLRGWWLPLELFPCRSRDFRYEPPRIRWRIPLGHRRYLSNDAQLHHSVLDRMTARTDYRPENVPTPAIEQATIKLRQPRTMVAR